MFLFLFLQVVPKCRAIQALCNLAEKGLIFLMNMAQGRTVFSTAAVSLGVDGGDDLSSITGQTVVSLVAPYPDAVDVFRPKKSHPPPPAYCYEGRARGTLLVNERMRRAVLEPHEPLIYQLALTSSSSSVHGVSLSAHQALVDSHHTKAAKVN